MLVYFVDFLFSWIFLNFCGVWIEDIFIGSEEEDIEFEFRFLSLRLWKLKWEWEENVNEEELNKKVE